MAQGTLKNVFNHLLEFLKVPSGMESQRFCWHYDNGLNAAQTTEYLVASPLSMPGGYFGLSGFEGLYSLSKVSKTTPITSGRPDGKPQITVTALPLRSINEALTHHQALQAIEDYNRTMSLRCDKTHQGNGIAPTLMRL